MGESNTTICNQALARLGAKRINDYDDASDTKPEAIYCRLFFDQTVKAHLKDHYWPFAKDRKKLSADSNWDTTNNTTTDWQYLYAYWLPNDFLRMILFYNGSDQPDGRTYYRHELEGKRLLTDEEAVYLRYIKYVPDVGSWDTLFTESLVLLLAKKLVVPLSQDLNVKADIDKDLKLIMPRVRAMDRQEEQIIGRSALLTWREARYVDYA